MISGVGGEPTTGGSLYRPLASDVGFADTIDLLAPLQPLDEMSLTITPAKMRTVLKRREPLGTRRVSYSRPRPTSVRSVTAAPRSTGRVEAIRWTIASTARPSRYETVTWTDMLRSAALGVYGGRAKRPAPPVLSGRGSAIEGAAEFSVDGPRRTDQHRHIHWLALPDLHQRGASEAGPLLRSLIAWAPEGLDEEVVENLVRISRIGGWKTEGRKIPLGVEGWGEIGSVAPEFSRSSSTWESVTPFVPSRHSRSKDFADHLSASIRQELEWRRHPSPAAVEVIPGKWREFKTYRPSKERLKDGRRSAGLRLRFDEPRTGPLALGALSHFGLGLFLPVSATVRASD